MTSMYESFKVVITRISRLIHKIEEKEMVKFSLKSQHISCLCFLYENKTLRAKEIVEMYLEDKAQVSRSLNYLESNEYIVCDTNGGKRYNSKYTLTAKGEEIARYINRKINTILKIATKELNIRNLDSLYKSLLLIGKNLENIISEDY